MPTLTIRSKPAKCANLFYEILCQSKNTLNIFLLMDEVDLNHFLQRKKKFIGF